MKEKLVSMGRRFWLLVAVGLILLIGVTLAWAYPVAAETWEMQNKYEALESENQSLEEYLQFSDMVKSDWESLKREHASKEEEIPLMEDMEEVLEELDELFQKAPIVLLEVNSTKPQKDNEFYQADFDVAVRGVNNTGIEANMKFLERLEEFPYPLAVENVLLRRTEVKEPAPEEDNDEEDEEAEEEAEENGDEVDEEDENEEDEDEEEEEEDEEPAIKPRWKMEVEFVLFLR